MFEIGNGFTQQIQNSEDLSFAGSLVQLPLFCIRKLLMVETLPMSDAAEIIERL
jgi:hypothetical protein